MKLGHTWSLPLSCVKNPRWNVIISSNVLLPRSFPGSMTNGDFRVSVYLSIIYYDHSHFSPSPFLPLPFPSLSLSDLHLSWPYIIYIYIYIYIYLFLSIRFRQVKIFRSLKWKWEDLCCRVEQETSVTLSLELEESGYRTKQDTMFHEESDQ
jgi:hypothetical protein